MSDLKACPFCGRIPDIEDCGEHRWFIRCKCGIAQDKLYAQKCDAVRAWNKRKELRVKDINVPITDTISRQAAYETLSEYYHHRTEIQHKGLREALDRVPSAEPETCEGCKHFGKWENEVEYGYPSPCTRCKRRVEDRYER